MEIDFDYAGDAGSKTNRVSQVTCKRGCVVNESGVP